MPKSYPERAREFMEAWQDKLDAQEAKEMAWMTTKWQGVTHALDKLIDALIAKEPKSFNELRRLGVYQDMIHVADSQVARFGKDAAGMIAKQQAIAAQAGIDSTNQVIGMLGVRYQHIPVRAVEKMIGKTSTGSPLFETVLSDYPKSIEKLQGTLIQSVALGRNPRITARLMKADMNGNLHRALMVARTEQLNVFREAATEQMKSSGLIDEWEWSAEPDACDVCAENDGKTYSLDEPMDTHPNCRCAMLPAIQ
jgi:SPP1 gp7 family putative phage head morphogenesis protein